ncbi:MAG: hypothetical protein ACRDHV_02465 [Actinomycetota bacterium]
MDPVTGFSRRSLLALAAAVALGVVASTVASVIETSAAACPDREYGCAGFEPDEPLQIAVVVSSGLGDLGVSASVPATVSGRSVVVLTFRVGCSVEEAALAARDIATDPPDGPPVLAAIAATCPAAAIPVAQILDDSGISLLAAGDPAPPPVPAGFALVGLEPTAAAAAVLEVASRVAVEHEGALLVPRTRLRDGLLAEGLAPVLPGEAGPGER